MQRDDEGANNVTTCKLQVWKHIRAGNQGGAGVPHTIHPDEAVGQYLGSIQGLHTVEAKEFDEEGVRMLIHMVMVAGQQLHQQLHLALHKKKPPCSHLAVYHLRIRAIQVRFIILTGFLHQHPSNQCSSKKERLLGHHPYNFKASFTVI